LRRVAQALVGTALVAQRNAEVAAGAAQGQLHDDRAAKRLDRLAEGLVELRLTMWQHRLAQRRSTDERRDDDAVAVEVVARCDVETQLDGLRVAHLHAGAEGLRRLKEVIGRKGRCRHQREAAE
jgi:hypothetical protein